MCKRCVRVSACSPRYTYDLVCRRRSSGSNMNSRNSDIKSMKGVCEWLPVPPDTHATQYVGDVVGAVILAAVIAKI